MRIGIYRGDLLFGPIDALVDAAQQAVHDGFASMWLAQAHGIDAMTAIAVVGREVPGIELATAVVPTYPRHPIVMAQQALTAQAISGGRFVLGIGLSHAPIIESSYGYSFEHPARHMREYLEALLPLVRDGSVDFQGETLTARAALDVRGASPVRVVLAAMGPRMLDLAGGTADGKIPACGHHDQHAIHERTGKQDCQSRCKDYHNAGLFSMLEPSAVSPERPLVKRNLPPLSAI